jgi:hypothetical protein
MKTLVFAMVGRIRKVSPAEVWGYWLRYEYHSRSNVRELLDTNFKDVVPYIGKKDYTNPFANAERLKGLIAVRRRIIERLPSKIDWWIASIDDVDISKVVLISAKVCRDFTNGTLKPLDAAINIVSNPSLRVGKHANNVNFILKNYVNLVLEPSRMIIIGPKTGPYTVIDGVHRMIGLFLYHYVEKRGPLKSREAYFGVIDAPWNYQFD